MLAKKLRSGGCVTFSSAAACTLGRMALPVYEVYKVGLDAEWLEGIDLLAVAGVDGAVIAHFNNAEGGSHDTRYCYMGERRLRLLEQQLPDDTVILGLDEHTACILDLSSDTATVRGNGRLTIRINGAEWYVEKGETVPLDMLRRSDRPAPATHGTAAASESAGSQPAGAPADAGDPFMDGVDERVASAATALERRDVDQALAALLDLDRHLWEWSRETFASDAMERARSLQRSLLVRLGELARTGARDPRKVVAPFVEELLSMRRRAREERRWSDADAVCDALVRLGVEVRDARGGMTDWELASSAG